MFATEGRVSPTYHAFSCERSSRANGRAARRLPPFDNYATCSRRDAVQGGGAAGASAPGRRTPLVGCYAELGSAHAYNNVVKLALIFAIAGALNLPAAAESRSPSDIQFIRTIVPTDEGFEVYWFR